MPPTGVQLSAGHRIRHREVAEFGGVVVVGAALAVIKGGAVAAAFSGAGGADELERAAAAVETGSELNVVARACGS